MKLPGATTPVRDLTRWNRSGLSRFRYVDGAAAEWLEELRLYHLLLYVRATPADSALRDPDVWREAYRKGSFEDVPPSSVLSKAKVLNPAWGRTALDGLYPADATYRQMLRAQYDTRALDQTRQISRAFARAFHVLTESLDAFANEGLVGTATQPEHLRRLLDMIGYMPRATTSAVTPVALILKADAGRQNLPTGLAFDHNPGDGGDILDFESLVPAEAHPALNMLRPVGWNGTSEAIPLSMASFMLSQPSVLDSGLLASHALLGSGSAWEPVTITAIDKAAGTLTLSRGRPLSTPWTGSLIRTSPALSLSLRPQGADWLHFEAPPQASVGQKVALELAPLRREYLETGRSFFGSTERLMPYNPQSGARIVTVAEVQGPDIRVSPVTSLKVTDVYSTRHRVSDTGTKDAAGLSVLAVGAPVKASELGTIGTIDTAFSVNSCQALGCRPPEIVEGAELLCRMADGNLRFGRVARGSLAETAAGFSFTVEGDDVASGNIVAVEAGFQRDSALVTELRSTAPLFNEQGQIMLPAADIPSGMVLDGRQMLIAPDPGLVLAGLSLCVTVKRAEVSGDALAVSFEEDTSSLAAFTAGTAVLYGNVVLFGHGKTAAPKAIGSGDSSIDRQMLTLDNLLLSTRPDPSFPGGAALDIEIRVGERAWRQVARFADSSPDEPVYVVTIGADGRYRVTFSQRLPTGKDNVLMTRRRLGAGARGNLLTPWQVTGLKPKHAAVDAIVQPLGAGAGADMEHAEDLRRQGTSYFTLADRAVAVADYAALAERHAGVWHAASELERSIAANSVMRVAVTVVPAGAASVDAIRQDLTAFLAARSSAGVAIDIRPFLPAPFRGRASVRLRTGYARSQAIIDGVRDVLMARFGLAARRLGQSLYVTEIVAAIEEMDAVENLVFTLEPGWTSDGPPTVTAASGAIQAVMPRFGESVFIANRNDVQIDLTRGGA